jgi:hypothetical protein
MPSGQFGHLARKEPPPAHGRGLAPVFLGCPAASLATWQGKNLRRRMDAAWPRCSLDAQRPVWPPGKERTSAGAWTRLGPGVPWMPSGQFGHLASGECAPPRSRLGPSALTAGPDAVSTMTREPKQALQAGQAALRQPRFGAGFSAGPTGPGLGRRGPGWADGAGLGLRAPRRGYEVRAGATGSARLKPPGRRRPRGPVRSGRPGRCRGGTATRGRSPRRRHPPAGPGPSARNRPG